MAVPSGRVKQPQALHKSNRLSMPQGYVDSFSALPGSSGSAVTGVDGHPDEGYYYLHWLKRLGLPKPRCKVSC